MRTIRWVLGLAAPAVLAAGAARIGQPEDGLTVHEWGTFTSVAGPGGEAVVWQPLSGASDLPCFVNRLGVRNLKSVPATIRMETPVIYFYAPRPVTASVRVRFPLGKITEWYPQASTVHDSFMEWSGVNVLPDAQMAFPVENGESRYYAARATDAAGLRIGKQQEKLIFYRGIGNFAVPVRARFDGDGWLIRGGGEEIPAAVLVENRGGRVAYLSLGAIGGEMRVAVPAEAAGTDPVRRELEEMLTAQGLYPKEARAMLETWQDSWLEEGTRLLYVVPRRMVDAVLPLEVNPKPGAVARVFVGRMELQAPWMREEIERLAAADDAATAGKYGRFLQPFLNGRKPGPRVSAYINAAYARIFRDEGKPCPAGGR